MSVYYTVNLLGEFHKFATRRQCHTSNFSCDPFCFNLLKSYYVPNIRKLQ